MAGLLLLKCRVEKSSAQLFSSTVDSTVAGGGTLTAVRSLYMLETVFSDNTGPQAGAMLLQSCGPVVVNSCTFYNNTASSSGGAVHTTASKSIAVDHR